MATVVAVGEAKNHEAFMEDLDSVRATRKISMSAQPEPYSVSTKCAAEFVAVMAFVVVGSLQALNTHDGILHAALSHGVAIFVLVSVFAHISGGHINPAVTLGVAVAGKMTPLEAICYVISQLAGGVLGALLVRNSYRHIQFLIVLLYRSLLIVLWIVGERKVLFDEAYPSVSQNNSAVISASLLTYDQYVAIQGGATLCGPNITWYQGVVAEALATFFLVQTVLVTAVDSTTALAPLAIGFTIIMDILAVGSISGASMNPGRSFGPNIIATIFMYEKLAGTFWTLHWIYYLGPSIGALMAVGLYRLFFAKDDRILL